MALRLYTTFVSKINDLAGKILSMLVFPMIFIMLLEVIMRYVFNRPTIWAHETATMLYVPYFLLGGAYALRWEKHVNVDIVYSKFSLRTRAIIDLITWICFYLFCGVLLLKGYRFAWDSVILMEHSSSNFAPPVWPVKLCIPLGAIFMLLQGLAKTLRDIFIAVTGRDFLSEMS